MFINFSKPPQISNNTKFNLDSAMAQSVGWSVGWSSCQSAPSYVEILGSFPGQSKRDIWWIKDHWKMFSLGT